MLVHKIITFSISDSYITEFNNIIDYIINEKPGKYIVNIKGILKNLSV
jgi:hypothetical protein